MKNFINLLMKIFIYGCAFSLFSAAILGIILGPVRLLSLAMLILLIIVFKAAQEHS